MSEARIVFKRLGIYYAILAMMTVLRIIPSQFNMELIPALYLVAFCVGLILYYSYRVVQPGGLKTVMVLIAWMELLFAMVRDVKYHVFFETAVLERHAWYMYYVPLLLIPLCFFYVSLLVSETKNLHLPKKWYWTLGVTIALIIFVMTNDLHQCVFRFNPGFIDWGSDYTYGWGFYAITFWEYLLYVAAVTVLSKKCRVSIARKRSWMILASFTVGVGMLVLNISGKMPRICGIQLMQVPEIIIFMVSTVLEVCMQLGMIPANWNYRVIFRKSSISAQITDINGKVVYKSATASDLTSAQMSAPDGIRIAPHMVLHRMKLPFGYSFWQDDVTELDSLNEKLAETKERLTEEAELTRLQNELDEKQAKIEQRSLVYDAIARRTQKQSQMISVLADEASSTDDMELIDHNRKKITILGAYIKRYANLMLLSADREDVEAGELALAFSEVFRYLNSFGISVEMLNRSEGTVSAEASLTVFEAFEVLLEENLLCLSGASVNLSNRGDGISCRLTLEKIYEAQVCTEGVQISADISEKLGAAGVQLQISSEDEITYITAIIPRGGVCV